MGIAGVNALTLTALFAWHDLAIEHQRVVKERDEHAREAARYRG